MRTNRFHNGSKNLQRKSTKPAPELSDPHYEDCQNDCVVHQEIVMQPKEIVYVIISCEDFCRYILSNLRTSGNYIAWTQSGAKKRTTGTFLTPPSSFGTCGTIEKTPHVA